MKLMKLCIYIDIYNSSASFASNKSNWHPLSKAMTWLRESEGKTARAVYQYPKFHL